MDLYLETDDDPQTLAFTAERNRRSSLQLETPQFAEDRDAIKALIERDDQLIVPSRRGNWYFNFRQTANNPLGVLRRLPADQSPLPDAAWEPVFDVDAFCAADGERWLFNGAVSCPDEPTRVLLLLSKGGSDLTRILEFDAEAKQIVAGGFDIPAARASATWLGPDEICYFGSIDRFSATRSGWPRVGRRMRRGGRPEDAPILFEACDGDVTGACHTEPVIGARPGEPGRITLFYRYHEIGKESVYVADPDGGLRHVDLPVESDIGFNHRYCLWRAKSGERIATGSLVLQPFHPFAEPVLGGEQRVLFSPAEGQTVSQFLILREWCAFIVEDRLRPRLFVLDLAEGFSGALREIALPDGLETLRIGPLYADLQQGDDTLNLVGQGFLQPPSYYRLALSDRSTQPQPVLVARQVALFDSTGMESRLLEAVSKDGTKVPYHLVLPKAWKSGELPVLQYGYGGFSSPLSAYYSGINGRWLAQGGAYVQAYIRGGSEFGPGWHQAAKRHGRHKAFEDFVAVARDLVERGFTKPARIACTGASNGGLLAAVMLTRYPADFGAIWSRVPVIDMTRFHTFPAGMAWVDEYGDPENSEDRAYLLGYSPLHNIQPASEISYPPTYIESSSNDDRVHPSHARRFALSLEEAGHHPLFHEFGSGGHGGRGNSGEQASRIAMGYSFLRQTIMDG